MNYDELVCKASKEELTFYHDFWKQYIALEKLVLETEKYVAISKDNENTFSIQYHILLQAICAEVDVVIKRLCYEYDSQAEVNDMYDYIQLITAHDSNFKDVKVRLQLYEMEIIPWKNIGIRQVNGENKLICPYWWNGYIDVKHKRLIFSLSANEFKISERNIRQAKQKNVLGALAGLFVLEEKCLEKMRARYREEFKKYDFPSVTVEISDKFNDSIFQKNIEVSENI